MSANICAPLLQMQHILMRCVVHCESYHGYGMVLIGLSDINWTCEYHHATVGAAWSAFLKRPLSSGESMWELGPIFAVYVMTMMLMVMIMIITDVRFQMHDSLYYN